MAGDAHNDSRSLKKKWSCASAPASGNASRSSGTPRSCAASYEHSSRAADSSTSMLAHIRLRYGKVTIRLSADGVRISSAENGTLDQAYGLPEATAANVAHSSLTSRWCSSTVRSAWLRSAVSKRG